MVVEIDGEAVIGATDAHRAWSARHQPGDQVAIRSSARASAGRFTVTLGP